MEIFSVFIITFCQKSIWTNISVTGTKLLGELNLSRKYNITLDQDLQKCGNPTKELSLNHLQTKT
jgi:hypothetical protein